MPHRVNISKYSLFFFVSFIILVAFFPLKLYASIYEKPRSVSVIVTKYFDIIFPKGAEQVAYYLASNADAIYEKASGDFHLQKDFRLPVALSFDSNSISASYSSSPYNRIILYYAKEVGDITPLYNDTLLLSVFTSAVAEAVASSLRSPFWQGVNNVIRQNSLQPVALLNIPVTFMDGVIKEYTYNLAEEETSFYSGSSLSDNGNLEFLITAKNENAIPSFSNSSGGRDIYSTRISKIAMQAFASYIQSRYGMRKFYEFWKECGGLHFFYLTPGIFKKVYKVPLKTIWRDFINSIPGLDYKDYGKEVIKNTAASSTYNELCKADNSIVYFDSTRKNLYKINIKLPKSAFSSNNSSSPSYEKAIKIDDIKYSKRFLSMATGITSLSSLPSSPLVLVSYNGKKANRNLDIALTQIYDTKKGYFYPNTINLSYATYFYNKLGSKAVAGFYSNGEKLEVRAYNLYNDLAEEPFFIHPLPITITPIALTYIGIGNLFCVYRTNKRTIIEVINTLKKPTPINVATNTNTSDYYELPVVASDFHTTTLKGVPIVSFTYIDKEHYSHSKLGYITLSSNSNSSSLKLKDLYLSTDNVKGGMHSTVITDSLDPSSPLVYFIKRGAKNESLRVAYFNDLTFNKSECKEIDGFNYDNPFSPLPSSISKVKKKEAQEANVKKGKYLGEYKVKRYNPFKYMGHGSLTPFFPISSLDIYENKTSPGLGLIYETSRDMIDILTVKASFCYGFIDTEADTWKINDDFTTALIAQSSFLPFDLLAGILWQFNTKGEYDIQGIVGISWNAFTKMSFNKLTFAFNFLWDSNTEYKDFLTGKVIQMENFPNPHNAYNTFTILFNILYSNYHQSGLSSFEERGVEIELNVLNFYDPQKEKYNKDASIRLTVGLALGFKFPFLIPFFNAKSWTVCLPTAIKAEVYGRDGNVIKSNIKTLLLGREVQQNIPFLNFYIKRIGLYFGYDFNLTYNDLINMNTDFKDIVTFKSIFENSVLEDYIYFSLEVVLSPNIGKFSSGKIITAGVQFQLDTRHLKPSVKAVFNMPL